MSTEDHQPMSKDPAQSGLSKPFPEIESFRQGFLPDQDGHRVYFELSGREDGEAVVFLHGGPGSGCVAAHRRFFDPTRWRAVLFDQRGCGRSTPAGGIEHNTTPDLVADMERLRVHLGIERWVVFGGSWGSTLALAYARRHPQRVRALVLRGVFLARRAEIDWFIYGLRGFLPEVWQAFADLAPADARDDLLAWYHATVTGADRSAATEAAHRWSSVESAAMALTRPGLASTDLASDDVVLSKARVQLHYIAAGCFLMEGELLSGLHALRGIPVDIVQGRLDPICPPQTAYELAMAMPWARLQMIPGAGHSAFEPGIAAALIDALAALPADRP